jgi:hypothetical protein
MNRNQRKLLALPLLLLYIPWFGYRYLRIMDSNRGDDGARIRNDFTQQGPTLGWAWRF